MRYRILMVVLFAAALAGCGVRGATTTGELRPSKPLGASHLGCPRQDRHNPISKATGANVALVPGHPQAVLLCRYSGLNAPRRFTLVSHRLITQSATVTRLAHALDALPKLPHGASFNCPADFGTAVVAFFRYAKGPEDPVSVELSGCEAASNGRLTRLADATSYSPVAAELERLTRR